MKISVWCEETSYNRLLGRSGHKMSSLWPEDNEFFKFYNELQQSAMYFSTLALRQMMPRGRGDRESHDYTQAVTEDSASITSAKISKKALLAPKPKPLVPVISVSEYQNVGIGLGLGGSSGKQKKVNFAHPLLVKSPTPVMMQMWECGGGGEGMLMEDGVVSNENFEDDYDRNDPSAVAESLAQYLSVGVCGDEDESQNQSQQEGLNNRRRKRRSRKRRNKDNHMEEMEGEVLEQEYAFYDENDPFASFEVPVNKEDYDFISDVRRCGGGSTRTQDQKPTVIVWDEDGRSQMRLLYGDGGAQRILTMEEAIEAHFLEESKKIIG